jgi:putative DNA primase/helicase
MFIRNQQSAEDITAQLKGRWNGGPNGYGSCRCILHDDRHASMTVRNGDTAPLLKCHAGCSSQDLAYELKHMGILGGHKGHHRVRKRRSDTLHKEPDPDLKALEIWHKTVPCESTTAETYLHQRGINLDIPPSIRFHPDLCAMVAAICRPTDRQIVSVQLTFLTPDGYKVDRDNPRLTYGKMGTGAIRLGPCTNRLGLAEGTENALSAMQMTGVPCWSSAGGVRLYQLTLPGSINEIHIFADNDGAGRKYADAAVRAYTKQGMKVRVRIPVSVPDWNDYLRQVSP